MNPDILYRIFPIALFSLLSHLYFEAIYKVDLLSVVNWWYDYASYTHYEVPMLMGLAFVVVIFYGLVNAISRNISALFSGKKHHLIYTGKKSSTKHQFYESPASGLSVVSSRKLKISPYSFESLYKTTPFIKDKIMRKLVIPHSRFSIGHLFFSLLFFVAFIPLYFHFFHLLAYVTATDPTLDNINFNLLWHESFLSLIQEFMPPVIFDVSITTINFSLGSFLFFLFIIVTGYIIQVILPQRWVTDKYEPKFDKSSVIRLPTNIQPGKQLSGQPTCIYQHSQAHYLENVVFKFDDGFSLPVYVTYVHRKTKLDPIKQKILNAISKNEAMDLLLTEKLTLKIN